MATFLQRLGARIDTNGSAKRMRRFREGWARGGAGDIHFYETAKVQYRYRTGGAGRTIVFMADPPATVEHYDALLEVFSPRYRVIVFEAPGMGFSAARETYQFGFRETNDDIALFLRAVAGEGAILAFPCVGGLGAVDIAA
ncbi:MAG: hypothetical protein AAGJ87_03750, partial [Pseudomonadota bacterium]